MNPDIVFGSLVTLVTSLELWGLMLAAIPLGMIFGAVPGLGGKLAILFSIPFVYGMDPVPGAVFLLAMHSVVHTGGSIPSILLGIPGTGPDAATVCDGYPMTQRGEAGRALGASLGASAVGGVLGAAFLAALIPVAQPIVLAFGPAEFFFLAVLGITFIAAVSGESLYKGILVGALGLMLSFVGTDTQTGVMRFTLGQVFLWDGVDVISAMLGVFAIPEVLALVTSSRSVSTGSHGSTRYRFADLWLGVVDVGRHWALTVRTSLIGAVVGLIPGLGGDVASWMCYGHAIQSSKTPERFGKGAVEGVIGPEAANNSKEGGALLPTIFFGIPGSSGMVIMLGAFTMLGIEPGPRFAVEHLDFIWIFIWTLVIANVLAALLFFAIGRWLALVPFLRTGLLVPFVLLFSLVGGFVGAGSWENLILIAGLGVLGCGLMRSGWPRSPLVIGLVLGSIMETSLHQSLAIWGPGFVFRPIALLLAVATVVTVALSFRRGPGMMEPIAKQHDTDIAIAFILFALFATMVVAAASYPPQARFVPITIGIPALILSGWQLAREAAKRRAATKGTHIAGDEKRMARGQGVAFVWLFLFILTILVGGFVVGGTLAVMASQRFCFRESWRTAGWGGAVAFAALQFCFERGLGLTLFSGWLMEWIR